jgi:hypothetical protein
MNRSAILNQTLIAALTATTLVACGGRQHTPPEQQGLSKNAPEWVSRGSIVVNGSVFGVAGVSGIKNPSHARTTAGNRARKEIAKILETYSASLMKDYSASTSANGASSEEQHVEEVVKTFSAQIMTGTEIVNNWIDDSNGTWYALAELNFDRAKEIASVKGTMGSSDIGKWLDQNGGKTLGGMEGDMKQTPPPPPAAPPATAEERPAAGGPPMAAPGAANNGPAPKTGAAPSWKDGTCDQARYLCGVGDGATRKPADDDARAEIARIFESTIKAVSQSFESAASQISSKTGEQWIEVSSVSEYSMVSTDKVVTMSQIAGRWKDKNGRFWSLAVIDRAQAGRALRDQIEGIDRDVTNHVARAKGASDGLARLKSLKRAVQAHVKRQALNGDLRVIDSSGRGIPSPHRLADLIAMLDTASGELKLGLAISGAGAAQVQACLEEALTNKGFQIDFNVDEDSDDELEISGDFDVIIKGRVRSEKRGKIAGGQVVKTTLTLKLINAKTGKIVRTISGSQKGTRRTVKAAASTSAAKICHKKVNSMVSDINRYFGK